MSSRTPSTIHPLGALILAGLATTLLASGCDTAQVSANQRDGSPRDSADQMMFGGRTVLAANGVRRGELAGDTVWAFDAGTRFEFQRLRAQFTTTLGRPLSSLTAPSGTYRIGEALFDTKGQVAITSDTTHRRVEGAAVRYDIARNQLSSDSPFVATAGARRLSGVGFTADPGLFTVKCTQRCEGSLGTVIPANPQVPSNDSSRVGRSGLPDSARSRDSTSAKRPAPPN